LVNAYKTAAKLALDEAEVVIKKLTKKFELTYSYELTSTVNSLIHQMELPIISQKFETDCTLVVEVELDKIDEFKNKVQQSFGVGLRDL
jgi:putative IMPACT (imprinted ancient) family translation regulator